MPGLSVVLDLPAFRSSKARTGGSAPDLMSSNFIFCAIYQLCVPPLWFPELHWKPIVAIGVAAKLVMETLPENAPAPVAMYRAGELVVLSRRPIFPPCGTLR